MASTTEDAALYGAPIGTVPAYDPANPYPVLDTPVVLYDFLVITPSQSCVTSPARGY